MKPSTILITSVVVPAAVMALWKINVLTINAAIGAVGCVCSTAPLPQCAVTAVAGIILAAMTAINGGTNSGTEGASTGVRDLPPVTHFLPDGTVLGYLNIGALEVGIWHTVQAGGHTLRASRHADGFNILRASLSDSNLDKRAPNRNLIEDVSAQFSDRN
ncbi:hypothetical protein Tdes44962_MAKER03761 [Teratosphaeria destructans]|uniref:Uncharacterized protein n=1 Tax=Teratosphaeria destructans TaxID=418781 RepID=A0A9W7SPT4_9PEZI|nr:hypothetical protein Tdes44962_MAKER03761 [Teratosphaeria destructans]